MADPTGLGDECGEQEHQVIQNPGSLMDTSRPSGLPPRHPAIEWMRDAAARDQPFLLRVSRPASGPSVTPPRPSRSGGSRRPQGAAKQKTWLKLVLSTGTTAWRLLGNPVNIVSWALTNPDNWSGFTAERQELLQHIVNNQIPDVASVAGDLHRHLSAHAEHDGLDPLAPVVLSEFGGTSVTPTGFPSPTATMWNDRSSMRARRYILWYDVDSWATWSAT